MEADRGHRGGPSVGRGVDHDGPAGIDGSPERGLVERVVVVAAMVLVVCGGGGFVLGLLGSWWWWFDLYAHFRLQCAASLAVGLGFAVAAWHRPLVAAAGLLLLADVASLTPHLVPEHRPSAGQPLRLADFNVLTRNPRKADVVGWIAATGADVVMLQEVDDRWAAALAATPGYRVVDVLPRPDNFGLAALVREGAAVEVLATERPTFEGLPALVVHLRHEGRELALMGLHTLPPGSGEYAAIRDGQLAAVAAWATTQASAGRAPVVVGDLNATPFSAGLRPLREAELRDSLDAGGLLWAGSWPDLPGPFRIAIDACWHDAALVTVSRTVGPALGSDHRPLEIALAWAR